MIPDDKAPVALEQVRKELEQELQAERFCGMQLVEVWINELAGAENGSTDAWQKCMEQVDRADAVIVIYNGHAGWAGADGDIGICHAEMHRAFLRKPSKLWLIRLDFPSDAKKGLIAPAEMAKKNPANQRFADEIADIQQFRGQAKDHASLKSAVRLVAAKLVLSLSAAGSEAGERGTSYVGPALDWSRLSYPERKQRLESVAGEHLLKSHGAKQEPGGFLVPLGAETLLLQVHGVPAGFGIAEARELVGRPFLRDHETCVAADRSKVIGPVHIILCHKSCTESQVISFIGQPDLLLVKPPFGLFVADQTNFVQAFFVTGCSDATGTVEGLQRVFDWIRQSGELAHLAARGRSRQRIVAAMAQEIAARKRGP